MPRPKAARRHANIKLRGKPGRQRYYVRVKIDGVDYNRGGFDTLEAAQIALADIRRDAERRELGLPVTTRMTLAAFAEERYLPWARLHKRPNTVEINELTLERRILPVFGRMALSDVTAQRVRVYLESRRADVKPATCNRELALLRHMMTRAVAEGLLADNVLLGLKAFPEPPERVPTLSREDEARLLQRLILWARPVVEAALLTGARQGELLALRWRHVDFDGAALVIEDSKNHKPRRVPLHPHLADALRARRGLPDGYVFTMPNGRPIKRYTCSQAFRRAVKREGLPLRFHDLRHVFATRWIAAGGGLLELKEILGHRSMAMVNRYAHVQMDGMRAGMARLAAPAAVEDIAAT